MFSLDKKLTMKYSLLLLVLQLTIVQFYLVAAYDDNNLVKVDKIDLAWMVKNIQEKLPDELKKHLPNITEGETMVEKRCQQYGKNESFSELQTAKDSFDTCINGIVEYGELQREIENEKKTGNLDKVFKKYCKKSNRLRNCVNTFADRVRPCLSEEEKQNMPIFTQVSEALTSFVCFKEGDRIALFIAEQGPECINLNYNNIIKNCTSFTPEKINETLSGDHNTTYLVLDENECEGLFEFQKCVVRHLETCPEPTPANIIDSLFKFTIKHTECGKYQVSSSFISISNALLIISALLCTLLRSN